MDERTRSAYVAHSEKIAARHLRAGLGVAHYFAEAFAPGARILDVGAGTGRDLNELVSEGWDAYGIEPVAEMRARALEVHPRIADRLFAGGELPGGLFGAAKEIGIPFDGILCSAVLQHLPREELAASVAALAELLRPGGRLLTSIPIGRPGLDETGRDELGRLFSGLAPDELERLCEGVGFRTVDRWVSPDARDRDGIRWATLLFELVQAA